MGEHESNESYLDLSEGLTIGTMRSGLGGSSSNTQTQTHNPHALCPPLYTQHHQVWNSDQSQLTHRHFYKHTHVHTHIISFYHVYHGSTVSGVLILSFFSLLKHW